MSNYRVVGIGEHGKYFDENAYHDLNVYIFNPEKATFVGGAGVTSVETAAEEMQQVAKNFGKDKGKRVRHSILSFGEKENVTPEQADRFAREIVQFYAPDFQICYAVHENTDDTHIHLLMNQISYQDGHRYEGKKKDYYAFMKHIKSVTHFPVIPVK